MYEDLFLDEGATKIAMSRLPEDVQVARERRMRRALDLSLKHKDLPEAMQNYDPFESYTGGLVEKMEAEEVERLKAGR